MLSDIDKSEFQGKSAGIVDIFSAVIRGTRQQCTGRSGETFGKINRRMELCSVTHSFIADKLITAAKNYTLEQLEHILEICVEYDYRMKSGGDAEQLIKEFIARIAGDV